MQQHLQETMDEFKGTPQTFVTSGSSARPDVALSPEMIHVNMIKFNFTLAHKVLVLKVQNRHELFEFCRILRHEMRSFLINQKYFDSPITSDRWNNDDASDVAQCCKLYLKSMDSEDTETVFIRAFPNQPRRLLDQKTRKAVYRWGLQYIRLHSETR